MLKVGLPWIWDYIDAWKLFFKNILVYPRFETISMPRNYFYVVKLQNYFGPIVWMRRIEKKLARHHYPQSVTSPFPPLIATTFPSKRFTIGPKYFWIRTWLFKISTVGRKIIWIWPRTMDTRRLNLWFFVAKIQIQIPIPNKYKCLGFCRNSCWILVNVDNRLTQT